MTGERGAQVPNRTIGFAPPRDSLDRGGARPEQHGRRRRPISKQAPTTNRHRFIVQAADTSIMVASHAPDVSQGYVSSFSESSGSPTFRIYDPPAIDAIGASGK